MKSSERKSYAYLTIVSNVYSLREIESFMGMKPDGSNWSKGDLRKVANKLRPRYEFSRWSLLSGLADGVSVRDQRLMDRFV